MGLDDELLHADGRGLLAEFAEDFDQFIVDAHRQIGRQARPEAHTLQFGVLLPVGRRALARRLRPAMRQTASRMLRRVLFWLIRASPPVMRMSRS